MPKVLFFKKRKKLIIKKNDNEFKEIELTNDYDKVNILHIENDGFFILDEEYKLIIILKEKDLSTVINLDNHISSISSFNYYRKKINFKEKENYFEVNGKKFNFLKKTGTNYRLFNLYEVNYRTNCRVYENWKNKDLIQLELFEVNKEKYYYFSSIKTGERIEAYLDKDDSFDYNFNKSFHILNKINFDMKKYKLKIKLEEMKKVGKN